VFARTETGLCVLGPGVLEAGDVICVLFGGKMPFCLWRWFDKYVLVGECYVYGHMTGEAIEMSRAGKASEKPFEIV
jgi:hypothetical protein